MAHWTPEMRRRGTIINQFFGNNAMVRNMSRVEAAPIYTSCQCFVSSCSGGWVAQLFGLGLCGYWVLGGQEVREGWGAHWGSHRGSQGDGSGMEGVGRNKGDAHTHRSLAGPLVEGVESLTMNGFRGIER